MLSNEDGMIVEIFKTLNFPKTIISNGNNCMNTYCSKLSEMFPELYPHPITTTKTSNISTLWLFSGNPKKYLESKKLVINNEWDFYFFQGMNILSFKKPPSLSTDYQYFFFPVNLIQLETKTQPLREHYCGILFQKSLKGNHKVTWIDSQFRPKNFVTGPNKSKSTLIFTNMLKIFFPQCDIFFFTPNVQDLEESTVDKIDKMIGYVGQNCVVWTLYLLKVCLTMDWIQNSSPKTNKTKFKALPESSNEAKKMIRDFVLNLELLCTVDNQKFDNIEYDSSYYLYYL